VPNLNPEKTVSRRLPVYVVLDTSESMIGPGIEGVCLSVDAMLKKLRSNPHALETVWLSFITFDSDARQIAPLKPLDEVQAPPLHVRPGTALGAALRLVAERIRTEVKRTTSTHKGDYRPLIFLITDGQATDEWQSALSKLDTRSVTRPANLYAIGCGADVDFTQLSKITDIVLRMDSISTDSFGKLFIWLTASVHSASTEVGDVTPDALLANLPTEVRKVDLRKMPPHDGRARQIFLRVHCQLGRGTYLMRYLLDERTGYYTASAAHPLTVESTPADKAFRLPAVDSNLLSGVVPCPFCVNDSVAGCGNCDALFCISSSNPPNEITCPACKDMISRGNDRTGGFKIEQSPG
jgi:uncharacterized protein YegL